MVFVELTSRRIFGGLLIFIFQRLCKVYNSALRLYKRYIHILMHKKLPHDQ